MIVITTGVKSQTWKIIDGDEFHYLIKTIEQPLSIDNKPNELEAFKINEAPQILLGEPISDKRIDGIKSRSVMFIDVDDMQIGYKDLADKVAGYLSAFGLNYVIYPTIRNGLANGARLRIGIQLSRKIGRKDYFKLWSWFVGKMKLDADIGGSGHTKGDFSHLQGIYVRTDYNEFSEPVIEKNGKAFPIDDLLPNIPDVKEVSQEAGNERLGDLPNWAIRNKQIMQAIFNPEQHYKDFNGWDNMLTAVGGWTYRSTKDIYYTAKVVQYVNELGSSPIPFEELKKKFKSWARNWR